MKPLSAWRYESDGGPTKTHYAVRDNASQSCGVERIDFKTASLAREFVRKSNALIFRTINRK